MLLTLLGRIKAHIRKVHEGNVCQDMKAHKHPDIVCKLIIVIELVKYLYPASHAHHERNIFNTDFSNPDVTQVSSDLSLRELCDRANLSVRNPQDDLLRVLCNPATYHGDELRECPYVAIRSMDDYVRQQLKDQPSHALDMERLGRVNCIHIRLNNLFHFLVDELVEKDTYVTVDIQRAKPLELDWLIAVKEGHAPRLVGFEGKLPKIECLLVCQHLLIATWKTYSPTTDWKYGGPLFDKYDLEVTRYDDRSIEIYPYEDEGRPAMGPTRLIAGMRSILRTVHKEEVVTVPAIVALSRLGPDVWDLFSLTTDNS